MRRSAAPSFQSSSKRLKFLSPFNKNTFNVDKENDLLDDLDPEIAQCFNNVASSVTEVVNEVSSSVVEKDSSTNLRSTSEILELISEATTNCVKNSVQNIPQISELNSCHTTVESNTETYVESMPENIRNVLSEDATKANMPSLDSENSVAYNVLWCKRSSKKHKIWEGDGTLIVRNRSAVLKDSEGKEIDRGIGYKWKDISALEEGSKFYIGGKECEIQNLISDVSAYSEKKSEEMMTSSLPSLSQQSVFKNRKHLKPLNVSKSMHFKSPSLNEDISKKCMTSEQLIIFPPPSDEHQIMYNKNKLPVSEVKVDYFLTRCLRPHQKEGIIFMYECIMGFKNDFGQGAILADEMGLGKTLQCIALIWTLLKQGPFGKIPVFKNVIIITPSSLVINWKKEFHKWLGEHRLSIFIIDKKNAIKDFIKFPKPVLIISYEMFLRSAVLLSGVSFDLVICDEGHRIKNLNIKISNVINCLSTTRRILLSGTPIQNDLAEFFSIVDFVNPGALGSIKYFRNYFEKPILQSRNQDCTEEERELGEEKSEELSNIVGSFMLRRTQEVINRYLPPKFETVIFCRATELQKKLYESLLGSRFVEKMFSSTICVDSSLQLVYISMLRKLCNHPFLLYSENDSKENINIACMQSAFPFNYKPSFSDSGKMIVLEKMLTSLFSSHKKEKVVIVSGFTKTLNLIENLCKEKGHLFLRLDGSTASSSRQDIVDVFNRSYTKYNVFLLSSKAGGVGLNLIGASRIILYDIDWNPANDLQAMARIWRDGQKHSVHIYRLLTTGTIEEKIYQRQLSKQCLSGTVLNTNVNEKLKFSQEELKNLFTFHENTVCLTHDLINCKCLISDEYEVVNKILETNETAIHKHNVGMEELMNWKHISGPVFPGIINDFMLTSAGHHITFLFMNKVNTSVT